MNPAQPWATVRQALAAPARPRSLGGGPCDPAADPDCSALMAYSSTCLYYGVELSDALAAATGAAPPIGLIHTAWGGSSIEQWLTNASIAGCSLAKASRSSQEYHDTRVLPYVWTTLKGFVWYQGENDMATIKGAGGVGYGCLMRTLVSQWRRLWSSQPGTTDPQAPFGVVTLASTGGEGANGLAMGAMRLAQTGGHGILPNADMPNTFLAQAYDLDDEWNSLSGGGPCMSYGYNASSPAFHCCGPDANASLCPAEWAERCTNMCAALAGTRAYMGGLHPRSKRQVGRRLAVAALNSAYGGMGAASGPTLAGCTVEGSKVTVRFDERLLAGDGVLVRPYTRRTFTPYFHGRSNPAFHAGSQLYVQTVAESFCIETLHVDPDNRSSPVFCPEWAGGRGPGVTQPAPAGRFPTFGGSGATTQNDPAQFNMGWIAVPITAGPSPSTITVDLSPLRGAAPTAVRYAWGTVDCCDLTDPDVYSVHGCIANCPIVGSGPDRLPANPFVAKIDRRGECVLPPFS